MSNGKVVFPSHGTNASAEPQTLPPECWAARYPGTMYAAIALLQGVYRTLYAPKNIPQDRQVEYSIPVVEKFGDEVLDTFIMRLKWPAQVTAADLNVKNSIVDYLGDLESFHIRQTHFSVNENCATILIETPFAFMQLAEAFCDKHPRAFDATSGFKPYLGKDKEQGGANVKRETLWAYAPRATAAFLNAAECEPGSFQHGILMTLPARAYTSVEDALCAAFIVNARAAEGMLPLHLDEIRNIINADFKSPDANAYLRPH